MSKPRHDALKAANQPIPNVFNASLLVDTGASHTSLDPTVFAALGLQPISSAPVHTPSTKGKPHICNIYDVALFIPGLQPGSLAYVTMAMQAFESDFQAQGIHGLLGRDVLASAIMHYNGAENVITISF